MSFGAGMAVGIGTGIAVGISSGQEQARKKIRQYSETHEITVRDKAGKPIPWDEFLTDATACHNTSNSTIWIAVGVVGLTALALGGAVLLWWLNT